MMCFKPLFSVWAFAFALIFSSCLSDSEKDENLIPSNHKSAGTFQVTLIPPADGTEGSTSILGAILTGPTPATLIWTEVAKSGSCQLLTPKTPFCDPGCGAGNTCVADNVCMSSPNSVLAGKVEVKGIKTKTGATTFTMDPLLGSYMPIGVSLDYPPFAEGDVVTFSASGDTGISAFTVSAKGISALTVLNDSINLVSGKPVNLLWTPAKSSSSSVIKVLVDISHHGGSKGKIECEGPDTGTMEIAANLIDGLKALGISGYPKAEISRKSTGINTTVNVDLIIESQVTKFLSIPGLISCGSDDDCPTGQTCQQDAQCK